MAEYVIYNIFKKGRRKTKIKFLRRNEKEGKKSHVKVGVSRRYLQQVNISLEKKLNAVK